MEPLETFSRKGEFAGHPRLGGPKSVKHRRARRPAFDLKTADLIEFPLNSIRSLPVGCSRARATLNVPHVLDAPASVPSAHGETESLNTCGIPTIFIIYIYIIIYIGGSIRPCGDGGNSSEQDYTASENSN